MIKITVVILLSMKRRPNVVLIFGLRRRQWYNIKPTESQVNVFTGPSECVFISQTNIYLYKSKKAKWGILKFEVWSQKSESYNLKWLPKNAWKKFQSICHNKNNPTKFKMVDKKIIKRSSNIVTWKITIPF